MTRIAAERHLPGSTPADAAALWWDTTRWPSFVDGFSHVHKREGDWPAVGGRLVWDARPGSDRGRVIERVLDRDADGGGESELEDARLQGVLTVRFAATGSGAHATLALDYALKGSGAVVRDLVVARRRLRQGLERSLERLSRELAMEHELAGEGAGLSRTPRRDAG